MFEELSTCKPEMLYQQAEQISLTLERENAEAFIRCLMKRAPELTIEQEKAVHRLGRKVLKRFHMERIKD